MADARLLSALQTSQSEPVLSAVSFQLENLVVRPGTAAVRCLPALRPLSRAAGCGGELPGGVSEELRPANTGMALTQKRHSRPGSRLGDTLSKRMRETAGPGWPSFKGGDRRPFGMGKSQSDHVLLKRVSTPALRMNMQSGKHLKIITTDGEFKKEQRARSKPAHVDTQAFSSSAENINSRLAELKSYHDGFDPRRQPGSGAVQGTDETRRNAAGGQADDDLHARLQAYTMSRRAEGTLPPLTLGETEPVVPHKEGKVVLKNALSETIRSFGPNERKTRQALRVETCQQRLQDNLLTNEHQMQELSRRFAVHLEEKQKRAAKTNAAKKVYVHKTCLHGGFAQQWLFIAALVGAAEEIKAADEGATTLAREALNARRGKRHEKVDMKKAGAMAMMLVTDHHGLEVDQDDINQRLKLLGFSWLIKKQIRERRDEARCIWKSMKGWQTAGKLFFRMRSLVKMIRAVQRWWRECSRSIGDQRARVSKRWVRLEKDMIRKELQKDDKEKDGNKSDQVMVGSPKGAELTMSPMRRSFTKSRRSSSKTAALSPEEDARARMEQRIQIHLVPESVRLRFLDHELRARRYFLLPKMDRWQEDHAAWLAEVQGFTEDSAAVKMMGGEEGAAPVHTKAFAWPPVRPSHLPPEHGHGGGACPEWCNGKEGDDFVRDWILAARKNHAGGWTEIPKVSFQSREVPDHPPAGGQGGGRKKKKASFAFPGARGPPKTDDEQAANPFGAPVAEEELQALGLNFRSMPCMSEWQVDPNSPSSSPH